MFTAAVFTVAKSGNRANMQISKTMLPEEFQGHWEDLRGGTLDSKHIIFLKTRMNHS